MNYNYILEKTEIGSLVLENRILQAPLAGYSNIPFRLSCWECGRPGLLATEMISAKSLSYAPTGKNEFYLQKSPAEGPLQYQIWGTDPELLGKAAAICEQRGADAVDINCGCPVRKVNASGAGVIIMKSPELIGRCISAMKRNVSVPVSAKIRIGPDRSTWNGREVAEICEANGADFISVHGRHGKESYNSPVRYEEISKIVDAVNIPVFGNGNIFDGHSAAEMLDKTGCFGIMVARGCMGNPWVFSRIKTELSGSLWSSPSPDMVGHVLLKNYNRLIEIMGESQATRHIRKLACFYSKGIVGSKEFRFGVNQITDQASFEKHVKYHFKIEQ
ncbi:MAG: tRNA dihydrouridine synthase [Planctomycetota bacterium]|jgi:nifR3 family TIM-barrel protein